MPDRETLDVDVLIVGAGPAGLAAAIRLSQLTKERGKILSVLLIEKGREIGAHGISGAVIDPKALRELVPDYEAQGCPIEGVVRENHLWFLTETEALPAPILPPVLDDTGHPILSLSQLVRWMGGLVERGGVDLFPGFPGVKLLIENGAVVGVRTGDKGLDKHGRPKPNYEPGVDIRAKITIIGEGPRGTLTRELVSTFQLQRDRAPQVYAIGVKEIWELPPGYVHEGRVLLTMGWPLASDAFGGSFIYSLKNDRVCVGFVVGLDYRDPFLDPHHELQRFKTHPKIRSMLEGGKMVEYGAKAIPEGGWEAVPKLYAPGAMLVGDSASLLDAMRLKGVHLAMKSGLLAAETAFEAIEKGDVSEANLAGYARRVEESYVGSELRQVRDFKKGFKHGFWAGLMGAGTLQVLGFSPFSDVKLEEGHRRMRPVREYYGRPDARLRRIRFDGKLTFSKVDEIFHSGTIHDENTPCHLLVLEPDVCVNRCAQEYGNPCQHFCPANVYEWLKKDERDVGHLQINFSNCVHCKTCDVMDPYGIIRWVPPEGGGGPAWKNL
ncbi:MAG: electron transfer flavoprotein-ubiquinone oxidoreductase [Planctomycetes bacterium]|nr:electron transfer flavoprotein-ubiquinone oxidoreductase [Planctomycetota bacterium]